MLEEVKGNKTISIVENNSNLVMRNVDGWALNSLVVDVKHIAHRSQVTPSQPITRTFKYNMVHIKRAW